METSPLQTSTPPVLTQETTPVLSTETENPSLSPKKFWMIVLAVLGVLIVLVLGVIALNANKTSKLVTPDGGAGRITFSTPSPRVPSSPSISTELVPKYIGDYSVSVKWPDDKCAKTGSCNEDADIYLKDAKTNQETFVTHVDNLQVDSRKPVYANGFIFLLKRFGNDNNLHDQLWVYTEKDQGKMLYDEAGLTFKVKPDGSAVIASLSNYADDIPKIAMFSRNSNWTSPTFASPSPSECGVQEPNSILSVNIVEWQKDSNFLWGDMTGSSNMGFCFWKLDLKSNAFTYYKTPNVDFFDLNSTNAHAFYTDMPPMFDTDSFDMWAKKNPTYSFYIYSIVDNKSTKIGTFPSSFSFWESNPYLSGSSKWVSDTEYSYIGPKGRTVYTLK